MNNVPDVNVKALEKKGKGRRMGRPTNLSLDVSSLNSLVDVFHKFNRHYSLDWISFYCLYKIYHEWVVYGRGMIIYGMVMSCYGVNSANGYQLTYVRVDRFISLGLVEIGYKRAVRGSTKHANVYVPTVKLQNEMKGLIAVVNGL